MNTAAISHGKRSTLAEIFNKINPYWLAILGNIIISLLIISYQEPFSSDGFYYLETAQIYLDHGLVAAFHNFGWAFYPLLIAWTRQITHLNLTHSAQLLSTVLLIATNFTYINVMKKLDARPHMLCLASLVFLLFPYINHSRDDILRGFAYYPLVLLSLIYLINYSRSFATRDIFCWFVCITFSTLFRIEGAIILYCSPAVIFIGPNLILKQRIAYTLKAYVPLISFFVLGYILLFILQQYYTTVPLGKMGQLDSETRLAFHAISDNFHHTVDLIQRYVLTGYNSRSASDILFYGLIGLVIACIFSSLSWNYLLLAAYGIYQHKASAETLSAKQIIFTYAFIGLLTIISFGIRHYFISERFAMIMCFLLMLWIPFALEDLYDKYQQYKDKLKYKKAIMFLITITALYFVMTATVHFGTSKAYIVKAGNWINTNTPQQSRLFVNNVPLAYYDQRKSIQSKYKFHGDTAKLQKKLNQAAQQADFAALKINRKYQQSIHTALAYVSKPVVAKFHNRKGDQVIIFDLQKKIKTSEQPLLQKLSSVKELQHTR